MSRRPALALLAAAATAGCSMGQFQTARTLPAGTVQAGMAVYAAANEMIEERGFHPLANIQYHVEMRLGVHERVDVGAQWFGAGGAKVDVKVNVMPPDDDFALAVQTGLGGAHSLNDDSYFLHLPINLLASYRFPHGISPYLGFGYGFYWVMDRQLEEPAPGDELPRDGWGDGVLRTTAGVEFEIDELVALLVEYDFLTQVVDDRGDRFAFVDSHLAGLAVRFRWSML
ncbi:MAG: porin family protein [Myxococcales bacterium]|nr:porin family protein [Myxococcales bacterium]